MITVGDFVLRHHKIANSRLLPLEKIEVVEGDCFTVINRYRATSNVGKKNVIELDKQYEKILWDELIRLEQQIIFLMDCQKRPNDYKFLQGVGLVKPTKTLVKVIPEDAPWTHLDCNYDLLDELSDARLHQVESKLTEFEEQHDFLMEAIESLY